MKKNVFATICAVALMISFAVPGYAAYVEAEYTTMSVEELAYCDLDAAPIALQDDILAAREDIIYSHSWTVDGQCVLIAPDGTVEELPEFYDLFPADWDVPVSCVESVAAVPYSDEIFFSGRIYLHEKTDNWATPFYTFTGNGAGVQMVLTSIPGATCNMGFTNITRNQDAGYVTDRRAGYTFGIFTSRNIMYGARASTNSTTGYASARVWG